MHHDFASFLILSEAERDDRASQSAAMVAQGLNSGSNTSLSIFGAASILGPALAPW